MRALRVFWPLWLLAWSAWLGWCAVNGYLVATLLSIFVVALSAYMTAYVYSPSRRRRR